MQLTLTKTTNLRHRIGGGMLCILFTVPLPIPALAAPAVPFPATIRVGLQTYNGVKSVPLTLTGPVEVWDAAGSRPLGQIEGGSLSATLREGRVSLSASGFSAPDELRLVPKGNRLIRVGKHVYPGVLELWKSGKALEAVNVVSREDYVYGALLIEGSPSMQPESLKALAVAIRTYSERSRGKHKDPHIDVCDTTHCQGYVGVKSADAAWARRAQRDTAGEILAWEGRPIWALYSTDCGGATANNEDGGAGDAPLPYLRGSRFTDLSGREYCAGSPVHRWTHEIPLRRLESLLNRRKSTHIGAIGRISIERADRFGRALTLRIEGASTPLSSPTNKEKPAPSRSSSETENESGDQGEDSTSRSYRPATVITISPVPSVNPPNSVPPPTEHSRPAPKVLTLRATALRSLLGESVLKSTFFTVRQVGETLRFEGRGYGHGVGMCVFGANGMAKAGIGYREILEKYYAGAALVRVDQPIPVNDIEAASPAGDPSAPRDGKPQTTVLYQRRRFENAETGGR